MLSSCSSIDFTLPRRAFFLSLPPLELLFTVLRGSLLLLGFWGKSKQGSQLTVFTGVTSSFASIIACSPLGE
jgi:hypothetical protein